MLRPLLTAVIVSPLLSIASAQGVPSPSTPQERPLAVFVGEGSGVLPGFGYSVASAGDVDGDGTHDLVVGAPYEGSSHLGQVKVYSGSDGALLLGPLTHAAAWYVGFSVAGIGDVNGDGRDDVLVGDPMFGGVGPGGPGQVFVFSGHDGAVLYHLTGDKASDEFGWAVCAAGDVDLDGVPDWAVGATADHDLSSGPSYVRLFSGFDGAEIRTYTLAGTGKRLGQSMVNAGDVNGDAVPDLLIGASGAGLVQMRSGADGSLLWQKSGPGTNTAFGWDVDVAGDVDGSGELDVIIGAPWAAVARVLRASDGALVTDITGPAGDFFGGAVAGLGDVDRDGFDDVAVGAKVADSPAHIFAGAAWIYSGKDQSVRGTFFGALSGDRFGFALAALPDLDGDGLADLAIGASQDLNAGPGYVTVYSGRRR